MKRSTRLFFKSFIISGIIAGLLVSGFLGVIKAYEGIRSIGFGENRDAIFYSGGTFYLFDFKIKL